MRKLISNQALFTAAVALLAVVVFNLSSKPLPSDLAVDFNRWYTATAPILEQTVPSDPSALANVKLNPMLAGEDANPSGAGSYPISTLTWILAYQNGNGLKAGAVRKSMLYLLSPAAQNRADDLGYVPLSNSILAASRKAVARISD
jgi:hypothetical protein